MIGGVYRIGAIDIDRGRREVSVAGRRVALRPKEFLLLLELSEHLGRAVPRDWLLQRVWGARYAGGTATIEIHVSRLRAKLGAALRLETVRGWGYRLRPPDAVTPSAALPER